MGQPCHGSRGGGTLPWLLGIATHKADNARRSVRRRQLFLTRQPQPTAVDDFAPEAVGRLDDVRRLRAVQASLGRLRRHERKVLALCVWSGLDYQQTAQALGIESQPDTPSRLALDDALARTVYTRTAALLGVEPLTRQGRPGTGCHDGVAAPRPAG
ncbi:RNA polymerase sigma factor [Streptomyces sp. P5-A9]|uniref:RNA polymerase sigma factor n=1 Tax=Streptomyces sp. P5-A9 TaxID=3071730 RepID=UPI003FCCD335